VTRIAACQLAPSIADLPANAELSAGAARAAIADGADVVVLPELVTSGYVFADAEEARSVAVRADHGVFAAWAAACTARQGAVVVGGFCEAGDDGLLYNSAALVDASGVRAVYRKAHLWDTEKRVFTPGSAAPPVVETGHGRIGVVVCYDLEFPEWTRTVALNGADLLVVPTNWPLEERPAGERPGEQQVAMSTARLNHLAIACADRTGSERGVEWTEGSCVVSADGWIVDAVGAGAGTAWADLDLEASRDKHLAGAAHLWDDRRPELYERVTAPRA